MLLAVLITTALVSSTTALQCLHNASLIEEVYYQGVLVQATSHAFETGVLDCGANLNLCGSFKTMDIAFFKTLDMSKVSNSFTNEINSVEGKVSGRCCMSQADADKITAQKADTCTGNMDTSCYCITDKCTGSAGGMLSMISLLVVLVYSIYGRS